MAAVTSTVVLPEAITARLVAAARAAVPFEACGLLLGTPDVVVLDMPARNAAAVPTARYVVEPADHFRAVRAAREAGLEVIGGYHSHPAGPAAPSAVDTAEAIADFLYLIVGLAPDPAVTGWRFIDGNFAPVRLVRT